jgi:Ca2+-binding RTX toxin-like protein
MRPVQPRSHALVASLLVAVAALAALAVAPASPAASRRAGGPCAAMDGSIQCGPGNNRRTFGGGEKVPHTGWPAISGVLGKVLDGTGRTMTGGSANDELLGHHGSDTISGGAGKDVVWGDWDPQGNTTSQRDVLRGGPGDDFIYPSHGTTRVDAGPGRDSIWAFYGKGTIDCGPGDDTARVRENGAFRTRNCERIRHFCQFGSKPNGDCRKPGETLAARTASGARG